MSSVIPQYAVYTVVYRLIYSVQDEVNLQTDLDVIRTWSTINKLPLNAAKYVVMRAHITRSHRPIFVSYHMGDTRLETVSTHKNLGIVLSSNLDDGAPMLTKVTSKAKCLLGFIWRTVDHLMILSPWRNCLLLLLDQSLSIVHHFGPQTGKVTNISWKVFYSLLFSRSLALKTFLQYQAPDSRYSHHYFPLWLSSYHVCCWVFMEQVWYQLGGLHQGQHI